MTINLSDIYGIKIHSLSFYILSKENKLSTQYQENKYIWVLSGQAICEELVNFYYREVLSEKNYKAHTKG